MNLVCTATLALGLVLPIAAQPPITTAGGCPYERSKSVAATFTPGMTVDCDSGIASQISGINISGTTGCPLFVIVTPTHDVAERCDRATRTRVRDQFPEQMLTFECQQGYFLFIPTSSKCRLKDMKNIGKLFLLETIGCVDPSTNPVTEPGTSP